MKTLKYILSIVLIIFTLGACEKDFLDVNDDPNRSVNVESGLLFMDVVTSHATNFMDIVPAMQYWSQQMGAGSNNAGVFANPESYQGLDGYSNSNTWSAYWSGLKSLRLSNDLAEGFGNVNGMAQCQLLESLIFLHTTIMWEDIPFEQAIDFEQYPTPDFDKQQDVLEGIIVKIDDALKLIDHDSDFSMDEILYNGDMDKWERFANSLKLKTLIFLATREPSNATYTDAIADIVANQPLLGEGDDMSFPYFDESGNKNPFYRLLETFTSGEPGYLRPGKVLVDIMDDRNDPRMEVWFVEGDDADDGEFVGVTPGEPATTDMSFLDPATVISADAPIYLSTYTEQELYIAEAIIRGWATGDAQVHFINAIENNLNIWEVNDALASTYISARPNITGISTDDALEEIWTELYTTNLLRPHEGFAHQKRTDFPDLILPSNAVLDDFITRWPIPNSEVSANPNAGDYKKGLTVKMWMDKQ